MSKKLCVRSESGTFLPLFKMNSFEFITRPSRTISTVTPAMSNSRYMPITSAFKLRADTTCCVKESEFITSIRLFMRAARSKSKFWAATCISCVSSRTNSVWLPAKNRSMRLMFSLYSLGVIFPQHAPGASPTWQSKQGRASFRASSARVWDDSSCFFAPRNFLSILRQVSHEAAHTGTTRRAMSTISRAARLSVKGPKYFTSLLCFSRVYFMAGKVLDFVSAINGYDLSSLKSALKNGAYWLIKVCSSTSASCSFSTTI